MEFYDPEVFKYYVTMARGFQPEPYNFYRAPVKTTIDTQIDKEIEAMKTAYVQEEENFVEDMTIKNPVVVERRKNTVDQERSTESIQRAESCRKSRVNNKIKKNKMRFRHQFASRKLKESSNLLNHMNELIADAEAQLLQSGLPMNRLQYLRDQFGMDSAASSSPIFYG